MSAESQTIPSRVLDEAAAWLARADAGMSAEQQNSFQHWLTADPRHAAAWSELGETWQAFDNVRRSGDSVAMVHELARRKFRRRWKTSIAVASITAAAAVAVVFLLVRPEPNRGIISRTEQRVLEDGSIVELDRGAEIAVNFEPNLRSVRLVHGQALFTVAKNPARPFVVSTDRVSVKAVGTAFSVQAGSDAVNVLVTEGKVAVAQAQSTSTAAEPVLVGAGYRLVVPSETSPTAPVAEAIAPAEIDRRLAWRGPRVELSGTRLRNAVELFNRESSVHLKISDDKVGDVKLSGVFRADDAVGFARLLEANYDIVTEQHGDVVELRAK